VTLRSPSLAPTHPGELLREDVIPATGLTVQAVAAGLGVNSRTLYRVISEKAAVSPEMAVRLGKYFGNGPQLWLSMQVSHDLWKAERNLSDEIAAMKPLKAA